MKSRTKKGILYVSIFIMILGPASSVLYWGIYKKVYNQTNVAQNTKIGANVGQLSLENIVDDMYNFPNRFRRISC